METFFITEIFKKNILPHEKQAERMNELCSWTECTSILDGYFKWETDYTMGNKQI